LINYGTFVLRAEPPGTKILDQAGRAMDSLKPGCDQYEEGSTMTRPTSHTTDIGDELANWTVVDEGSLVDRSPGDLDALFRASPPGDVPIGVLDGTVILFPGSRVSRLVATIVRAAVWRGKVVEPAGRALRNRLTPLDLKAIAAVVYPGRSLVDGADCIVLDYSITSVVASGVRDEIRLVAPHLYLGVVWLWRHRVAWFTLRVSTDR
jgi:hypothetical protein